MRVVSCSSESVDCVELLVGVSCMKGSTHNCESVTSKVGSEDALCALQELNSVDDTWAYCSASVEHLIPGHFGC